MTTATRPVTRHQVEDFLYAEAALLDAWQLNEWLDLCTAECGYYVPSTDQPDSDHRTSLFIIADDRARLASRVAQLLGRFVHAENPHSRTRRLISNVRILGVEGDTVRVSSNFIVYRIRLEVTDAYVGRYEHTLVRDGEGFKIKERRAILDLDALRPHGKVSFLL